jgi:hypothetical protein
MWQPPESSEEPKPVVARTLPFALWWPILAGVLVGLLMRFVFSGIGKQPYSTMSGSFLFLSPVIVGMVTVYVAEKAKRRTWYYYFYAPFLANVFFVLGSLAILIEGLICAIIIVPLFAVFGGLAGLAMGLICRLTDWPKQTLYSIAALPLLLGGIEQQLPLPNTITTVERTVLIAATPETVWWQLENSRDIQPDEVRDGWMYRIGVPLPQMGVTEHTTGKPVRHVRMGKGIHFDQVATVWEPNHRVVWAYRFTADSFPPHALDDHVRIGGEYFDLIDTEYQLTSAGGHTALRVRMSYRVSTRFNWYAKPVAEMLTGNFEEVILDFYANRALRETRR